MGAAEISLVGLKRHAGAARVAAAALCLWVAAAHVHGDFTAARRKLVTEPMPQAGTAVLPLPQAASWPGDFLVFIYRAHNTGTTSLTISTKVAGRAVGEATIGPGESRRVDVAWPRPSAPGPGYGVVLESPAGGWTLEYAELANLHGFTRGAVEFVILPAQQRIDRAPFWIFVAWLAAVAGVRWRTRWPQRAASAHLALAAIVLLFFAAVAVAPALSPFRLALAPHTFAAALAILIAPSVAGAAAAAWRALYPAGRDAIARPWRGVLSMYDAAAATTHAAARRWRDRSVRAPVMLAALPWLRLAVVVGFVAYAAMLWLRVGAYAGGSDQSGYLNSARLIAEGRTRAAPRMAASLPAGTVPDTIYTPLGFRPVDGGALVPTYPVGLPVLTAAVAQFSGWTAAGDVTMVLHALAGVLLTLWLARECGLSPALAALAALLLATSPLYLFMSLILMSDMPALVWVTAAVLFAWRGAGHGAWILAAGAAASLAVLIRPTNALVFAPIALCLGFSTRRWLLLLAGGCPGALLLGAYNTAAYGAPLATGYVVNEQLFAWANLWPSLRNYAAWLPVLLTPVGALAAGLPLLRRREPRLTGVLLLWIAGFLALYAFYRFTGQTWWYLRFVLPAFPPLIVAALWIARDVLAARLSPLQGLSLRGRAARASAGAALAVAVLVHNGWWATRLPVLEAGRGERKYYEVAEWTRAHLPARSVVMAMQASGALFYYTDFPVLRWDFVEPDTLHRLQADALAGGAPLYAVLFPYDLELNAFRDRLRGDWVHVASIDDVTIWRFGGGRLPDVRKASGGGGMPD